MRISFVIWLAVVVYAITAAWAIDTYWKHDTTVKVVLFAPLLVVALSMLFEDQIWKIRHAIARRRALREPVPMQDTVTVHLRAESLLPEIRERWDIFTLQEDLRQLIKRKKLGSFDGNEIGDDEAILFISGPDGEAVFRGIEPVLRACPLCRGGVARISPSASGSPEREVSLSSLTSSP